MSDLKRKLIPSEEFKLFADLIHQWTGIFLSDGKKELLTTRLEKRLNATGIRSFSEYYQFIRRLSPGHAERVEFVNAVTTNKTEFFREPSHFEFLRTKILIPFRESFLAGGDRRLRIWSSAASTGQEPYTIAMIVQEVLGGLSGADIRILATDIDTQVLKTGRDGVYPEALVRAQCSKEYIDKYFTRDPARPDMLSVKPVLKQRIDFRPFNLVDAGPWPFKGRFDAIFCRNVIIYFTKETQRTLVSRFVSVLKPNAHLMLGHSESMLGVSEAFDMVSQTTYRLRQGEASEQPVPVQQQRKPPARAPTPAAGSIAPGPISILPPRPPAGQTEEKRIGMGDFRVGGEGLIITTTVGSCVAACIYDEVTRVGGMNHVVLPDGKEGFNVAGRVAEQGMLLLVNKLKRVGADPSRLVAKIYGGANLSRTQSDVGGRNATVVETFLAANGIRVVEAKVRGSLAIEVSMNAGTGKTTWREVPKTALEEHPRPTRKSLPESPPPLK